MTLTAKERGAFLYAGCECDGCKQAKAAILTPEGERDSQRLLDMTLALSRELEKAIAELVVEWTDPRYPIPGAPVMSYPAITAALALAATYIASMGFGEKPERREEGEAHLAAFVGQVDRFAHDKGFRDALLKRREAVGALVAEILSRGRA